MSASETVREFLHSHAAALATRLAEHAQISAMAILLASIIGVALAMATYRRRAWWVPLLAIAGMLQTVPGIALLVIMMALFGRIGAVPALSALTLYALLPIVQNTLVGLHSLSPMLSEAARGLGLNRWQRLRFVRLPLALPVMIAGLRTAAVQTIGLTTLAAFVGAGGLGQFINRGLFLSDNGLILLGAIPAALMALLAHFLIGLLGVAATPHRSRRQRRWALGAALGCTLLTTLAVLHFLPAAPASPDSTIRIGSKNFTEQLIVAEMVAQQIERQTKLHVERRFGLGGSSVMHQALVDRTIDLGVEYTGTALGAILHRSMQTDPAAVFATVRDAYAEKFQLNWLKPLGFNNSYQLAVREDDPVMRGVRTISALTAHAATLTAAFDFEFAERADGYAGLRDAYGLRFARVLDMHPDLLYTALKKGNAQVISAYATDGRLEQPGLRVLRDDRHFFPPYQAAIVVSQASLRAHPELKPALEALSGRLDDARMRQLNAAVDAHRMRVEEAAAAALDDAKPMVPSHDRHR